MTITSETEQLRQAISIVLRDNEVNRKYLQFIFKVPEDKMDGFIDKINQQTKGLQ